MLNAENKIKNIAVRYNELAFSHFSNKYEYQTITTIIKSKYFPYKPQFLTNNNRANIENKEKDIK